ncbi:glucosaminidase domain-containing protein [Evansella sp. LMS18]|uniref:N-acetylglucosaminidase n=1 Tax=Evansella sp. LMS18 TaxID=2924033 RepID=UPI0020D13440|nr:glucosaminidase domain-containing protein [Evansella sp. LMS18]
MSGRGNAFREAANTYSVNEFYLLSHSILETGHGTSPLSNGSIRVGRLGTNKWVSIQPDGTFIAERNGNTWSSTWTIERVNNFDESQAQNIKQTYNMFGIGAIDSCPYVCGSIRAYEEGWDTANKAIVGGTRFIAQDYVHHPVYQQDTLYKMRWNPGQPGTHQYATDIGWAYKQTSMLYRHYQNLPHLRKTFDIPNYR